MNNLKLTNSLTRKKVIFEPIDAKKISTAEDAAIAVYQEALDSMNEADFFYASKKFSEAEGLLPQTEWAAKSSLMSSYCLYAINFYDEAEENLMRYLKNYPGDDKVIYAYYLLAIIQFEQISNEEYDLAPLLESKKRIDFF